jgi:glycosyltransferase involved in cell wall biosynthesis
MRSAHEVQCNGYPMYTEAARYTPRRLLYLDSRMTEALLIPDAVLEQRLSELGSRPLRLVYSGRYENMKGALQAVQGVRAALERGADVEMDCYGAGSLAEPMRRVAATSGGRIRIHDAIAFEELVAHTRQFDLFICCHIQSDPSCTYLESMGSGLAVLGYANGMWSELAQRSGAGMVLEKNSPSSLADAIIRTAGDLRGLRDWSRNAINFARQHTFERESQLRIDSFKAALA